jgi:folate-binding protein YgfZ
MLSSANVIFAFFEPKAVLKVTGEDALAFLQGQFTQDLRNPEPAYAAYGLWLNQKGKVLADSYALQDGREWWLISRASAAQEIVDRLSAYIIADDVELADVTSGWRGLLVGGEGFGALAQAGGRKLPGPSEWARWADGVVVPHFNPAVPEWLWLFPKREEPSDASADQKAEALLARGGAQEVSLAEFERRRIRRGEASVPLDLGSSDLPNEAGFEKWAVSYTKGCYLGQEVMARLHAMGQVRRRLLVAEGAGAPPAEGSIELFAGEKRVGELRSVVAEGAGFVGLALVNLLSVPADRLVSLGRGAPRNVRLAEVAHD